ncbi:hypothetical protein V8D89_009418 [Ganoderma adspersum]
MLSGTSDSASPTPQTFRVSPLTRKLIKTLVLHSSTTNSSSPIIPQKNTGRTTTTATGTTRTSVSNSSASTASTVLPLNQAPFISNTAVPGRNLNQQTMNLSKTTISLPKKPHSHKNLPLPRPHPSLLSRPRLDSPLPKLIQAQQQIRLQYHRSKLTNLTNTLMGQQTRSVNTKLQRAEDFGGERANIDSWRLVFQKAHWTNTWSFADLPVFWAKIDAMFTDPNEAVTAQQTLKHYHMHGKEAQMFFREFEDLVSKARYSKPMIQVVNLLKCAVNSKIIRMIYATGNPPGATAYDDWKNRVMTIDTHNRQ